MVCALFGLVGMSGYSFVDSWLPGCLVGLVSASKILGLLGLYKVRSGRGMAG